MHQDGLPQVFLHSLDVSIPSCKGIVCLAYSDVKCPELVPPSCSLGWSMQLPRDSDAEKTVYQNINHCHCLLVRDGVNLRPLCKEVRGDLEVSISLWL
jgi:hypothetical protein